MGRQLVASDEDSPGCCLLMWVQLYITSCAVIAQKVLKKVLKKNKNGSTSICRTILLSG